jgi:hypothetical protein
MVLRRTRGEVGIASRITGVYADHWSGRRVTYTRLRCPGGKVTVAVASDVHLFSRSQTVSSSGRRVTFSPSSSGQLTVPLRPREGVCRAVFTVAPTAVPALAEPGSTDTRVLGARFLAFLYTAP